MRTIFEKAGKVKLELDEPQRLVVGTWLVLGGAHYRKGIDAIIGAVTVNGVSTVVSDSSTATDVPSQADLIYTRDAFLRVQLQLRQYISVVPRSLIAKMGISRLGRFATEAGLERATVATVEDALELVARSRRAA